MNFGSWFLFILGCLAAVVMFGVIADAVDSAVIRRREMKRRLEQQRIIREWRLGDDENA